MTKQQVLALAKQNKVEFINVLFTDILGLNLLADGLREESLRD